MIKTLCIPKFIHIATVIPNLSIEQIKEIEKEFELFLNKNNPSVTDKTSRYMGKRDLGLGMLEGNENVLAKKIDLLEVHLGITSQGQNKTVHFWPDYIQLVRYWAGKEQDG